MLTVNVGQGQRAGSAATRLLSPVRASGAQRAAGEHRGQLPVVVRATRRVGHSVEIPLRSCRAPSTAS